MNPLNLAAAIFCGCCAVFNLALFVANPRNWFAPIAFFICAGGVAFNVYIGILKMKGGGR